MEIKTKLIPKNTAARSGYSMAPKYITIHNTANTSKGADAESHANYLQNSGKNSSVSYHYVVDDREAYKLLPDNEVAWHAGDGGKGTGNRQSLAIEICENVDGDLLKATDNAVELTAQLMKAHNIPLSNVVQHNKWSGKNCPARIRKSQPYDWQTFLKKVQAAYAELTKPATDTKPVTTTKPTTKPTTAKPTANPTIAFKVGDQVKLVAGAKYTNGKSIPKWLVGKKVYVREIRKNGDVVFSTLKIGLITGVVDDKYLVKYTTIPKFKAYKVRITADALNVRSGPGTSYKAVAVVKKNGVYTIVEENNGWGKLKSGAGWISLKYTQKV